MSLKTITKVHGTLLAAAVATLAAGCSSTHPRYYSSTGANGQSYGATSYQASSGNSANYQQGSEASGSAAADQTSGNTVIPLYQETIQVGTRQVDAGSVRLRKVVTTETVNQPVQVRRETLVIEREPASQSAQSAATANLQGGTPGQAFQEQETVIQLKKEEPVVETRMVPTGRIVAQKRSEAQQQNVQRQVRREDIQVEKIGNPENVIISDNLRSSSNRREATGASGSEAGQNQGSSSNGAQDQTR